MQQKNHGYGGLQIGRLVGNVTIVHLAPQRRRRGMPRATAEHRAVLQQLDGLPDRRGVLAFMRREFGTAMVLDLAPPQLYRVRRYAEVVAGALAEPAPKQSIQGGV